MVTNRETGYTNKINSMMDHVWDGFYSGQLRMSRFPVLVEGDKDYTVKYTGTPPGKMRYILHGNRGGIKVAVPYPNAGAYQVVMKDVVQKVSKWDPKLGRNAALAKRRCGENRFVGIANILEFYLTPGCELTVRPLDSI